MSVDPTPADQAASDPAPLVPTDRPAPPVTVGEIAEFLGHLTDLRTGGRDADPHARAAFLARKAELFARLDTDSTGPAGPPRHGWRTP